MKISKKVLSMVICGFIVFGGSQANLIKAHAASSSTTSIQNSIQWKQTVRFKLRAKWNTLYKAWWSINLVYRDGRLTLEGPTNIPGNLTFDDTFVLGYRNYDKDPLRQETKIITQFRPSHNCSAGDALRRAMDLFNRAGIKRFDTIFMNGENWNDTLKFSSVNPKIIQNSNNNYSNGYITVDKFKTGFKVEDRGLVEQGIIHYTYFSR